MNAYNIITGCTCLPWYEGFIRSGSSVMSLTIDRRHVEENERYQIWIRDFFETHFILLREKVVPDTL